MTEEEAEQLAEKVKMGLTVFLSVNPDVSRFIKKADFDWGSIYRVGNSVRVDIFNKGAGDDGN